MGQTIWENLLKTPPFCEARVAADIKTNDEAT